MGLVKSNKDHAVADYGSMMLGSIWFMTGFSLLFVGFRVLAKVKTSRSLWWDDFFLIISWINLMISSVLLTQGVKWGVGMHFEDMVLDNIPKVAEFSYAAGFATILGTAWSKTSFGITLLRISDGWVKWFVWFLIISINLILGTSAVVLFVQCQPIGKLFNEMLEGNCWPKRTVELYQTFCSVYSGATDIVLALLPWKIVWNATIFRREKIGALIAMSMGVFSGIMSFMKIIKLNEISDVRATTVDLKILGIAELAITIIAVSIPVLRAFIRRRSTSEGKASFVHMSQLPSIDREIRGQRKKGGFDSSEIYIDEAQPRKAGSSPAQFHV